MGLSLKDQLLQAGLLSKKQDQKIQQEKRQQPRRPQGQPSEQARAAEQAQAAKAARDQTLNQQQREKAEKKARQAEIRQLILNTRLPRPDSHAFYNFTDGKKIKGVEVTPEMRERLIRGELAIVRHEGHYAVVPLSSADRIRERDPERVMPLSKPPAPPDPDDPYKDFVVPDDLVW